jgi:urocanate hydratase
VPTFTQTLGNVTLNQAYALTTAGTYTLVALAQAGGTGGSSALNGATYIFIDEAGPTADSITQPIGTPLTTNLTIASETTLQVVLTGRNGNSFQYPDQVVNASINIQSSTYTY